MQQTQILFLDHFIYIYTHIYIHIHTHIHTHIYLFWMLVLCWFPLVSFWEFYSFKSYVYVFVSFELIFCIWYKIIPLFFNLQFLFFGFILGYYIFSNYILSFLLAYLYFFSSYFRVFAVQQLSRIWLSVTPGTVARQAPLSVKFPRQSYWSGQPFPSPEDLPDPGIEPGSPTLQADSLPSEPPGKPLFLPSAFIDFFILTFQLTSLFFNCLYSPIISCIEFFISNFYLCYSISTWLYHITASYFFMLIISSSSF